MVVQDVHQRLMRRAALVRLGCALMVAAVGASGAYAGLSRPEQFADIDDWPLKWAAAYAVFLAAYATAELAGPEWRRRRGAAVAVEALSALYLTALYPAFLVTSLLVVIAWQIAWSTTLRTALGLVSGLAASLVVMKCTDQTGGMSVVILLAACAFQLFGVATAQLARSEAEARIALVQANADLEAAQLRLAETTRMGERLRISRDLHDALGHSLTTMTIQLDVAARLSAGPAADHLAIARDAAASLLDDVRSAVGRLRMEPVDLRAALEALKERVSGLDVTIELPADLPALDPARAETVLRCVQEVITNTLRHAGATRLTITLSRGADGMLAVTADDDGRGGAFAEGQGLRGMRERFEALGGTLEVMGAAGAFRIRGAIPAMRSA